MTTTLKVKKKNFLKTLKAIGIIRSYSYSDKRKYGQRYRIALMNKDGKSITDEQIKIVKEAIKEHLNTEGVIYRNATIYRGTLLDTDIKCVIRFIDLTKRK